VELQIQYTSDQHVFQVILPMLFDDVPRKRVSAITSQQTIETFVQEQISRDKYQMNA